MLQQSPQAQRIPALLDPGHNHNFSIQEQHLIRWAGVRPEMFRVLGNIRESGRRVPLHAARLWLHPNIPGQREPTLDCEPHPLKLPQGIAVYPADLDFPPMPLLGLRAVLRNNLALLIDGERQEVSLRTAHWFSRLLRMLRLPPY